MARIMREEELAYNVNGYDIPVYGVAVEADTFEEAYEAAKNAARGWCVQMVEQAENNQVELLRALCGMR